MAVVQERGSACAGILAFFLLLAALFAVQIAELAAAAEQHQVGGTPGWSLPSLANVNYTVWASTQTFKVGDTLYFNYSSAFHNVLEVTQANYESCKASDAIQTWTDGADIIALNSSGTFYYICGFPGHCDEGQKVAVEVAAAVAGTRHQVGGPPGWSLPSRSNVNYTEWASTQTFLVGDTLYFNYSSEYHNVMEVSKADYDSCNASRPIQEWDDGATVVQLSAAGTFYYICGVPGHCAEGQKVAVAVTTGSSGSSAGGGAPSPTMEPVAGPSAPPPGSSSCRSHSPISSALLGTLLAVSLAFHFSCGSSLFAMAIHV